MITLKTIVKGLVTILKIIALSVIVIGGSLLIIRAFEHYQDKAFSKDIVTPVIVGLRFLILLLVAFLAIYFISVLWKKRHVFGDTTSARLIGFGAMAIIFPGAVYGLIRLPLYFTTFLVKSLPERFLYFSPRENKDGTIDLNEVFRWIVDTLQRTIVEIALTLERFIEDLSITSLVLGLALWVIIGQWISSNQTAAQGSSGQITIGNRFVSYYHRLSSTTRHNILLAMIFILSSYFSLAAIVAIPSLQQGKQTGMLSKERVEQKLNESIPTREKFDLQFDYKETDNPFSTLVKLIDYEKLYDNNGKISDEFKSKWKSWISRNNSEMIRLQNMRKEMIANWNKYREQIYEKLQGIKTESLNSFDNQMLVPLSQQQRIVAYQEVIWAVNEKVNTLISYLQASMNSIDEYDKTAERWASNLKQDIEQKTSQVNTYLKDTNHNELPNIYGMEFLPSDVLRVSSKFYLPSNLTLQFNLPDPGLGSGPFGWVANWLIRMQSTDLTLIVGMLGFGLFGAAISSFVREQSRRALGEPPTDSIINIPSVMIRGLSAAIVVFLAVKGGLAIFTVGSQDPNAYVLFFACLVGSVFSEKVWSWASRLIEQKLPSQQSTALEAPSVQSGSDQEKTKK